MTEKRIHALIEQQDLEKIAAAWRAFENKSKIKEQKTMAKSKKRTRRKVIALFVALVLIAGVLLAGYCSRVDGKWYANGAPSTWRWGGIWTEDENSAELSDLRELHALSDKLEAAALVVYEDTPADGICTGCGYDELYERTEIEATCTETGTARVVCAYCGRLYGTVPIPARGHNGVWTYTSAEDIFKCTRCGAELDTREHTHSYSWTVTIEPTQEAEGEESYKCLCGNVTETRTIPRLAEPVELPANPVKEGYTFTGWYFDEACTQPYDGRPIYADTVLYAGWKINTFTVTFDSAGGGNVAAQTVDWNMAATLSTPERIGYKFLGWYLTDGTQYEGDGITANITLTAKWERLKCTVNFYVDGALYTSLTVDYGTPLITAAEIAGFFQQNITAYAFINGEPVGELSTVKVTDDMTVSANEPTKEDKIKGAVNSYWLPVVSGVASFIAAALILWVVFGGKKRKR